MFERDPVHDISPPEVRWSRNNTAEAAPGVLTPMAWGLWQIGEAHCRRGFADLGLLPRASVAYPDAVADRMFGIFHGRMALNALVIRKIMCALPGVTGDEVERDILGYVPEGVSDDPYPWRGPAVAAKAPPHLVRVGREARALRVASQGWWEQRIGPQGPRPGVDPSQLLPEATELFGRAMILQTKTRMVFQAASSQLVLLAARVGAPDAASSLLASTAALEETAVADELWQAAHGRMTLDAFIARHGFHGPNSGNLASFSWREDSSPIQRVLGPLRSGEEPGVRRARTRMASACIVNELVAGMAPAARLGARLTLRLAPAAARNLECTKTAYLIAFDGARAATRGIGARVKGWGSAFPFVQTCCTLARRQDRVCRARVENEEAEMADVELAVLRALRLKGRAGIDDLAAATGLPASSVEPVIARLMGDGGAREVRGAYMLLPAARERLEGLLAQERTLVDVDAVAALYEQFTPVNADFKVLASDWQMRGDSLNDHSDAGYDADVLGRLPGIHERVSAITARLGELVPRLAPYGARLQAALDRVSAGDSEWLLKPLIDSYHTVWFELHEELISLAGLNRADEAAAGRAH